MKNYTSVLYGIFILGLLQSGCSKPGSSPDTPTPPEPPKPPVSEVVLKAYSITEPLVVGLDGDVKIFPLLSSEDTLKASPEFIYGSQPDGGGLLKNPSGEGYVLINNHEVLSSVSRVYLDKTFKPIRGEYIVDAVGGGTRLCSATMATPAIHGFGPVYLTAGESGEESMVHGIDPFGPASDRSRTDRTLPALGKANMENAVPLPKLAFPGKTIVMIGEDQGYWSGHASGGQLLMYVSSTVGDLKNGDLYALRRVDQNPAEMSVKKGSVVDVEFVKIPDAKIKTGAEINTLMVAANALRFARVEDVDYRKGNAANNREVYFSVTGQSYDRINPIDPGFTMWGRVYRVTLNENDPSKGKLEVIAEGDSNPGKELINPDNLCVTENFVYIQEDGDSNFIGASHDSYIWQYNLGTKQIKPWLTMNHKRDTPAWNAKFNTVGNYTLGSWEYGAMHDISDETGVPNTFLLNLHVHTWQRNSFVNADRSGLNTSKEGGQTVILSGVPN